jgi:hypothetical protein
VTEAIQRGEGFPAAVALKNLLRAVDGPVAVYAEGCTLITLGRSMAAGAFLRSGAPVWLSLDDDACAEPNVLRRIILGAQETRGLVALPAIAREGRRSLFRVGKWTVVTTPSGKLARVKDTSFSCVAMHRDAVQRMAGSVPWCFPPDPKTGLQNGALAYPALFQESVYPAPHFGGSAWAGEDVHFCTRLNRYPDMQCYVAVDAPLYHAGDEVRLNEDGTLDAKSATVDRLQALANAAPHGAESAPAAPTGPGESQLALPGQGPANGGKWMWPHVSLWHLRSQWQDAPHSAQ